MSTVVPEMLSFVCFSVYVKISTICFKRLAWLGGKEDPICLEKLRQFWIPGQL